MGASAASITSKLPRKEVAVSWKFICLSKYGSQIYRDAVRRVGEGFVMKNEFVGVGLQDYHRTEQRLHEPIGFGASREVISRFSVSSVSVCEGEIISITVNGTSSSFTLSYCQVEASAGKMLKSGTNGGLGRPRVCSLLTSYWSSYRTRIPFEKRAWIREWFLLGIGFPRSIS